MNITIEDIIKKYDTNINTENMSKKLRETIIFSDKPTSESYFEDENITINDIPQPKHETIQLENKTGEQYTYKFGKYTIIIEYKPNDYRTMNIELNKETPEDEKNKTINYLLDYKGDNWGVNY